MTGSTGRLEAESTHRKMSTLGRTVVQQRLIRRIDEELECLNSSVDRLLVLEAYCTSSLLPAHTVLDSYNHTCDSEENSDGQTNCKTHEGNEDQIPGPNPRHREVEKDVVRCLSHEHNEDQ